MSKQSKEPEQTGVQDEALPDDLVPDEDNPLAEGLPEGETVEGLLDEGKDAEQTSHAPAERTGEETDPYA